MKTCDLHNHSLYSDGSLSPAELIKMAEKKGLSALALTDHNTAKGLKEFMTEGKVSPVETAPGCEFTTEYKGNELHIVGLFFPETTWEDIEKYVDVMKQAKKKSNHLLIERLEHAGYDISYDEVANITDADEFNRAHVARIMLKKGYISTVSEAFDKLLYEGGDFYEPPQRLDVFETIRFIKEHGAVCVMAHPFLSLGYEELVEFLPLAKAEGMDAMETDYSSFSDEQTVLARHLADQFGLEKSGGSDFHGDAKPGVAMGTGKGKLCVPYDYYAGLKKLIP